MVFCSNTFWSEKRFYQHSWCGQSKLNLWKQSHRPVSNLTYTQEYLLLVELTSGSTCASFLCMLHNLFYCFWCTSYYSVLVTFGVFFMADSLFRMHAVFSWTLIETTNRNTNNFICRHFENYCSE